MGWHPVRVDHRRHEYAMRPAFTLHTVQVQLDAPPTFDDVRSFVALAAEEDVPSSARLSVGPNYLSVEWMADGVQEQIPGER